MSCYSVNAIALIEVLSDRQVVTDTFINLFLEFAVKWYLVISVKQAYRCCASLLHASYILRPCTLSPTAKRTQNRLVYRLLL